MQYRYRALRSWTDPGDVRKMVAEELGPGRRDYRGRVHYPERDPGFGAMDQLTAGAQTPRRVEANDGEADDLAIEAMLHRGQLAPTDLVFEGGTWRTFSESERFSEVCAELEDLAKQRRLQKLRPWLLLAGLALAALLLIELAIRLLGPPRHG